MADEARVTVPKQGAVSSPLAACGAILAVLALLSLAHGYERSHRTAELTEPPAAHDAGPAASGAPQVERLLDGRPIDLNRATADELQLLPRIGPALAARIVEERERGGPFRSVEDLARVRGIGPRTIERIAPLATALAPDAGSGP